MAADRSRAQVDIAPSFYPALNSFDSNVMASGKPGAVQAVFFIARLAGGQLSFKETRRCHKCKKISDNNKKHII